MSYNTRIRTKTTDNLGRDVEVRLKQRDWQGGVTDYIAGYPPFEVEQGSNNTSPFTEFKPSQIVYYLNIRSKGELDFILSGSETDFKIEVLIGNPVVERYEAFVFNDMYEESRNTYPQSVSLTGGDALGRLADLDYDFAEGRRPMIEVVRNCLNAGGQDFPIAVSDDLSEDTMTGDPWGVTDVDDREFVDRNFEPLDCATVLRELLKSKGCSICQATGDDGELYWFIHRRQDLIQENITCVKYVAGSQDGTVTIPGKVAADKAITGVSLRKKRGYRKIERNYDHGFSSANVIKNGDFSASGEEDTDARFWEQINNDGNLTRRTEVEVGQWRRRSDGAFVRGEPIPVDPVSGSYIMGAARVPLGQTPSVLRSSKRGLVVSSVDSRVNVNFRYYVTVLDDIPFDDVVRADTGATRLAQGTGAVRVLLEGDSDTKVYNNASGNWETDTGQNTFLLAGAALSGEWATLMLDTAPIPNAGDVFIEVVGPSITSDLDEMGVTVSDVPSVFYDAFNVKITPDITSRSTDAESTKFVASVATESTKKHDEVTTIVGDGPFGFNSSTLSHNGVVTESWGGRILEHAVNRSQMAQLRSQNEVLDGTFIQPFSIYRAVEYKGKTYIPNYLRISNVREGYYEGEIEEYKFDASSITFDFIEDISETRDRTTPDSLSGGDAESPVNIVESIDGVFGQISTGVNLKIEDSILDTEDLLSLTGIDAGNLQVRTGLIDQTLGNLNIKSTGDITLNANEGAGDVYLNGEVIKVDKQLSTADSIILINADDPGTSMTPEYAGLEINNPGGNNFFHAFRRDDEQIVIGDAGTPVADWQPLLTRENSPIDKGLVVFNQSSLQGTTSVGLKFDDDTLFFPNAQTIGDVFHPDFASGWAGSNWQITPLGYIAGESLFLRGTLTVNELVFNRIHAVDGEMIISPGRGKIESVSGNDITLYDPSETGVTSFATDDIVIVQRVNPDHATTVKRLVRRVLSVDNENSIITVTTTGIDNPVDVGVFAEGDTIVVIGNTTNPERRDSIVLSASSAEGNAPPYQRFLSGVDSWAAWTSSDKIAAQIGNLSGLPMANSSFGLYGREFDFISGGDYWRTSDNSFRFGGDFGIYYNEEKEVIDDSEEVLNLSEKTTDGRVTVGSDFHVRGDAIIDGNAIIRGSVTTTALNFSPLISADGTGDIVATINASSEGLQITGSKIELNGDTTVFGDFEVSGGNITGGLIKSTDGSLVFNLNENILRASKLVIKSGSGGFMEADFFLDSIDHQLSVGSVFSVDGGAGTGNISGILTIGENGKLRTFDDETVFDEDGIRFNLPEEIGVKTSLLWGASIGENTAYIGAKGGGTTPTLEYRSAVHDFRNRDGSQVFGIIGGTDDVMNIRTDKLTVDPERLPKNITSVAIGEAYLQDTGSDYYEIRIRSN